jgi:IclR family acetate operon transcriptional repressor
MRKEPTYKLNSVDRALVLLHLLRDQGSVTITEAAETLQIGVSTAHRLLTALVFRDFAVQDSSRAYRAGPALGLSVGPGRRVALLRGVLGGHLEQLRDRTRETANLSVLVGASARIIAAAESPQALHVGNQVGTILPAHRSAAGRAELSRMDDRAIDTLLSSEPDVHVADVLKEVRRTRERGYAVNYGEAESNICAIGVALLGADGEPMGALVIAMPSYRFDIAIEQSLADELAAVARSVQPLLTF